MPESTPAMASSQMPPTDSSRASGLVTAFQKPAGKSAAISPTLVEPTRSAEATSSAPPEASFKSRKARPSASRSVVESPGSRRSSSGTPSVARAASS